MSMSRQTRPPVNPKVGSSLKKQAEPKSRQQMMTDIRNRRNGGSFATMEDRLNKMRGGGDQMASIVPSVPVPENADPHIKERWQQHNDRIQKLTPSGVVGGAMMPGIGGPGGQLMPKLGRHLGEGMKSFGGKLLGKWQQALGYADEAGAAAMRGPKPVQLPEGVNPALLDDLPGMSGGARVSGGVPRTAPQPTITPPNVPGVGANPEVSRDIMRGLGALGVAGGAVAGAKAISDRVGGGGYSQPGEPPRPELAGQPQAQSAGVVPTGQAPQAQSVGAVPQSPQFANGYRVHPLQVPNTGINVPGQVGQRAYSFGDAVHQGAYSPTSELTNAGPMQQPSESAREMSIASMGGGRYGPGGQFDQGAADPFRQQFEQRQQAFDQRNQEYDQMMEAMGERPRGTPSDPNMDAANQWFQQEGLQGRLDALGHRSDLAQQNAQAHSMRQSGQPQFERGPDGRPQRVQQDSIMGVDMRPNIEVDPNLPTTGSRADYYNKYHTPEGQAEMAQQHAADTAAVQGRADELRQQRKYRDGGHGNPLLSGGSSRSERGVKAAKNRGGIAGRTGSGDAHADQMSIARRRMRSAQIRARQMNRAARRRGVIDPKLMEAAYGDPSKSRWDASQSYTGIPGEVSQQFTGTPNGRSGPVQGRSGPQSGGNSYAKPPKKTAAQRHPTEVHNPVPGMVEGAGSVMGTMMDEGTPLGWLNNSIFNMPSNVGSWIFDQFMRGDGGGKHIKGRDRLPSNVPRGNYARPF